MQLARNQAAVSAAVRETGFSTKKKRRKREKGKLFACSRRGTGVCRVLVQKTRRALVADGGEKEEKKEREEVSLGSDAPSRGSTPSRLRRVWLKEKKIGLIWSTAKEGVGKGRKKGARFPPLAAKTSGLITREEHLGTK